MYYIELKNHRTNILSSVKNKDVVGNYFLTTIFSLESVEKHHKKSMISSVKSFKKALTNSYIPNIDDYKPIYGLRSLARHEHTHCVDFTCNAWRLSYLNFMAMIYSTNSETHKVKNINLVLPKSLKLISPSYSLPFI